MVVLKSKQYESEESDNKGADEPKDERKNEPQSSIRFRDKSGAEGWNSIWVILLIVFGAIFLWNSYYQSPHYDIPLMKIVRLIDQGYDKEIENKDTENGDAGKTMVAARSTKSSAEIEDGTNSEEPAILNSGKSDDLIKPEDSRGTGLNTGNAKTDPEPEGGLSQEPFVSNGENGEELSEKSRPYIIVEEKRGKKSRKVRYSNLDNIVIGPYEITGTIVREVIEPKSDKPGDQARKVTFHSGRQGLNNDNNELFNRLKEHGFENVCAKGPPGFMQTYGMPILTLGILLFFVFWFFRRIGAGAMAFGQSRGKLIAQEDVDVSFQDVAGVDEAVEELREIVDFLKMPEKFQLLGGRIPKGVLLVGPPGTGKTLLAKAVAGEANVPFYSLSGSDFVELYAGIGAARVRDLFQQAQRSSPNIIFIDELDALGKARTGNSFGGHEEREQTLNALLVEMDGFGTNSGTIVMAATNRPEILDSALLRPGRFDRQVLVDRPDIQGREDILRIHASKVKLAPEIDLHQIASITSGFVGADLAALVNEAALLAARAGMREVTMAEFTEGVERITTGLEKKRRVITEVEKKRVSYHECGHALMAYLLPNADPVHKVSIIPRGLAALGYTLQRPDDERYLMTQHDLETRIQVLLAGTVAEEIVFQNVSTGAQNDLERATSLARGMVMDYGMSKLGKITYRESSGSFLNENGFISGREHSERTAWEIDQEVRAIISNLYDKTKEMLSGHLPVLIKLANRLLKKEVIGTEELEAVIEEKERETEDPRDSSEAQMPNDEDITNEAERKAEV